MAEGENKTEKKTIEMSIWFIILLVVIIISCAIIFSMNNKLGEAQKVIETKEKEYAELSSKYSMLVETVGALTDKVYDLSTNELKSRLQSAIGQEASNEVVSGETLSTEVVSGEVLTSVVE